MHEVTIGGIMPYLDYIMLNKVGMWINEIGYQSTRWHPQNTIVKSTQMLALYLLSWDCEKSPPQLAYCVYWHSCCSVQLYLTIGVSVYSTPKILFPKVVLRVIRLKLPRSIVLPQKVFNTHRLTMNVAQFSFFSPTIRATTLMFSGCHWVDWYPMSLILNP